MVRKSFLIVLALLALTNCSKPVEQIPITVPAEKIKVVHPLPPAEIKLSPIKWKVLNVTDTIYYGLTVSDYELLSLNMLDIKQYIIAQKNLLQYYKQVTQ